MTIDQDADLWIARIAPGATVRHAFRPGRHGWIQVVRGTLDLNGHALAEGDGAALSSEPAAVIKASGDAEVLLFDLG